MKLEFSRQTFDEYSNIKFHENLPIGSCIVLCRQDILREGQTDMLKLTVTFPNFANAPKKIRPSGDNIGTEIHLFEG
jgi:hypothetical protein